jgi:hypothetical protein
VLVDETMMKAADEDEIVQIGGPPIRPGDDVVDLEPAAVATTGEPTAASIPFDDQPTQPGGDLAAPPSDTDRLDALSEHRLYGGVAGKPLGSSV